MQGRGTKEKQCLQGRVGIWNMTQTPQHSEPLYRSEKHRCGRPGACPRAPLLPSSSKPGLGHRSRHLSSEKSLQCFSYYPHYYYFA